MEQTCETNEQTRCGQTNRKQVGKTIVKSKIHPDWHYRFIQGVSTIWHWVFTYENVYPCPNFEYFYFLSDLRKLNFVNPELSITKLKILIRKTLFILNWHIKKALSFVCLIILSLIKRTIKSFKSFADVDCMTSKHSWRS